MRTIANAIIPVALAAIAAVWIYHEFWAVAARPLAYTVTLFAVLALVPAVLVSRKVRFKDST